MTQVRTVGQLRQAIEAGEAFDYLLFWGHTMPEFGDDMTAACLSQWFAGYPFLVEGMVYTTAEHYMMAQKAKLFDDKEMFARIVGAPGPKEAKALGRKVSGFEEDRWLKARTQIVVDGNFHKFYQHPLLRDYLLDTEDQVLVEASPRDRIWGIGMGARHVAARDPHQWRGQNLLGFALMEAAIGVGRAAHAA